MDVKSYLGIIPGGLLIAGGCAVFIYTRIKYERTICTFKDLEGLERHLLASDKGRSYVIVEGTVAKLAENSIRSKKAGIEGAARKVLNKAGGKTTTASNISVPFLVVDPNGCSIHISSIHQALRISRVMEKVWDDPSSSELMLIFGTQLGLYGCASLNEAQNEITLTPEEVDESLAVTVSSRNLQKRLLYAGSFILVLGGSAFLALLPVYSTIWT